MFDRVKEAFVRLVRQSVPRLDYLAQYSAKVVSQNADGSLELQPDDARLPSLSQVPVRYGLPGVAVKVASSSRVLLGFENGDPAGPVAQLWDASSMAELLVTATTKVTVNAPSVLLGDGTAQVVRNGDSIGVGLVAAGNPVTGTIVIASTTKVKA